MAKKPPPKKGKANAKTAFAPPAARQKMVKPKAKAKKGKIPTLGGSLTGLGGTGAQGMMP